MADPPVELTELIRGGRVQSGGALDLGCGPGVVTGFLATRFRPAVGLDIAHPALLQAKAHAAATGVTPVFAVAEAPLLPVRSGAFSLVFDRGCLQAIPRSAWPGYVAEVERVLAPGGYLLLFVSRAVRAGSGLSVRRIRVAARRMLGKRAVGLGESVFQDLLPETMTLLEFKSYTKHAHSDRVRQWVVALFGKAG